MADINSKSKDSRMEFREWTPAVTKEAYEYAVADRVVAAAGRIRAAERASAEIQTRLESRQTRRGDGKAQTMWASRRAGAANEIVMLVRGMEAQGYPGDPNTLGEMLMERYREMIRNERAGREPCPRVYVPDDWIKGLHLPEILALAPRIWDNYIKGGAA